MSRFSEPMAVKWDAVASYSRAQAIEDGVLVDVTEWGSHDKGFIGGFRLPVAMTAALWAAVAELPARVQGIEDVRGRAHDVLWMASLRVRGAAAGTDRAPFSVIMNVKAGRRILRLLAVVGPGDAGEPVLTLGFPEDF